MDGIIPYAMIYAVQQMITSLGSGFEVKGIEVSKDDLPESGELGEIYLVSGEGYTPYTWDGTESAWMPVMFNVATAVETQSALYS